MIQFWPSLLIRSIHGFTDLIRVYQLRTNSKDTLIRSIRQCIDQYRKAVITLLYIINQKLILFKSITVKYLNKKIKALILLL